MGVQPSQESQACKAHLNRELEVQVDAGLIMEPSQETEDVRLAPTVLDLDLQPRRSP